MLYLLGRILGFLQNGSAIVIERGVNTLWNTVKDFYEFLKYKTNVEIKDPVIF